jgi:hypothetical protein
MDLLAAPPALAGSSDPKAKAPDAEELALIGPEGEMYLYPDPDDEALIVGKKQLWRLLRAVEAGEIDVEEVISVIERTQQQKPETQTVAVAGPSDEGEEGFSPMIYEAEWEKRAREIVAACEAEKRGDISVKAALKRVQEELQPLLRRR